MDRLTVGVISVIGLLAWAFTNAMVLLDVWVMHYRQSRQDRRLYGRNVVMARMLEHTPQSDDPTKHALRNGDSPLI